MKPNRLRSTTEKAANIMIVVMVLAGTVAFSVVNNVSEGSELMTTLFLAFLGAIITVQFIPGLVLVGAMMKGLARFWRKREVPAEATEESKTGH
jgi:hypothetical protein